MEQSILQAMGQFWEWLKAKLLHNSIKDRQEEQREDIGNVPHQQQNKVATVTIGSQHSLSPSIAALESSLSESGGMHRELKHRITLTIPGCDRDEEDGEKGKKSMTGTATIWLYMLLHIPNSLFVNVEDLFQGYSGNNNTTVTLLPTGDGSAIDQEEPAFVSPPHALLVCVEHTTVITATTETATDEIEFATKLHVRYPAPRHSSNNDGPDDDNNPNFVRAILHPPWLVAGYSTIRDSGIDKSSDFGSSGSNNTNATNDGAGAAPSSLGVPIRIMDTGGVPLVLWIAVGHDSYLRFVSCLRIAVSGIGAVVMLRDIVRASRWNWFVSIGKKNNTNNNKQIY
jgi:PIG-X / PBN1